MNSQDALRGTWALLWSQSQSGFHIEPLARMLESNRQAYAEDRRMDYVPLHIGTADECHGIADSCRKTVATRYQTMKAAHDAIDAARVRASRTNGGT